MEMDEGLLCVGKGCDAIPSFHCSELEQRSMKGRKNKNTPHQVEDSVGSVGKFSPQGARCERD